MVTELVALTDLAVVVGGVVPVTGSSASASSRASALASSSSSSGAGAASVVARRTWKSETVGAVCVVNE